MVKKAIKLSDKQKEVIRLMRDGYFLYENTITPGARWCLTKYKRSYNWGNVNGNVIYKIKHLFVNTKEHIGVFSYQLTKLGKSIQID